MFKLISCEEKERAEHRENERMREREREKERERENRKATERVSASERAQIHFPCFSEASECQQSNYKHEQVLDKRIQVSTSQDANGSLEWSKRW